jgi:divalent metal cation (Fe/Co/Zn/Cd) transporter
MVLALTSEQLGNIAVAIVLILAAGAVLSAILIKKVVGKLIALAVLAVLIGMVWAQRANLMDCADQVQQEATRPVDGKAACKVFGIEVDVPVPGLPDVPGVDGGSTTAPSSSTP